MADGRKWKKFHERIPYFSTILQSRVTPTEIMHVISAERGRANETVSREINKNY